MTPWFTVRAPTAHARARLRLFLHPPRWEPDKHGFTFAVPRHDEAGHTCDQCGKDGYGLAATPGSQYTLDEVVAALVDVARGATYVDAVKRLIAARDDDADLSVSGQTASDWVGRYGPAIAAAYAEREWPQTVVLDSTLFKWTNPRGFGSEDLFSILAVWGYPAGEVRGRLWALTASKAHDTEAWKLFLQTLPGRPEVVVSDDADSGIAAAVRAVWPRVKQHRCEHHLYVRAANALRADGQRGMGNQFRVLLNDAFRSPQEWAAFRDAVLGAGLPATGDWVRKWDKQLTAQTSWRAGIPAHYSTGALDPKLAVVRQYLRSRRWTFRNMSRMNNLLGLMRLHINRRDQPGAWAKHLRVHLTQLERTPAGVSADGHPDYRTRRTIQVHSADPVVILPGGAPVSVKSSETVRWSGVL
jgi:Transposase, Mutator family